MAHCLLGNYRQNRVKGFLVGCGVLNVSISMSVFLIYFCILKSITRNLKIGRSHSKDVKSGAAKKVMLTMGITVLTNVPVGVVLIVVPLTGDMQSQTISTLVILLFPLQIMINPFLYGLNTKEIIGSLKRFIKK